MASGDWIEGPCYWLSIYPQGSTEWLQLRDKHPTDPSIKLITGSRAGCAAGLSRFKTPERYAYEMITGKSEILDQVAKDRMALGNLNEPVLRRAYESLYKVKVKEVGLAISKLDSGLGASPDGLVGEDGLVEFKYSRCISDGLRQEALMRNFDSNYLPPAGGKHIYPEYYSQMQMQMFIFGRKWCDFVVYGYEAGELYTERVYFDPTFWNQVLYPGLCRFRSVVIPQVRADLPRYEAEFAKYYGGSV